MTRSIIRSRRCPWITLNSAPLATPTFGPLPLAVKHTCANAALHDASSSAIWMSCADRIALPSGCRALTELLSHSIGLLACAIAFHRGVAAASATSTDNVGWEDLIDASLAALREQLEIDAMSAPQAGGICAFNRASRLCYCRWPRGDARRNAGW